MRQLLTGLMVVLTACGGSTLEVDEPTSAAEAEAELLPGRTRLPSSLTFFTLLARIGTAPGTAHEAIPAGVPGGYDWRERSVLHTGNTVPAGFTALTGWGQAFWVEGSKKSFQSVVLRSNQTFVCSMALGRARWQRVQNAGVEGAAFSPDYAGNVNTPALLEPVGNGTRVTFGQNPYTAFHWWPNAGRALLPTTQPCGVLFLFEAMAQRSDGTPLGSQMTAPVNSDIIIGGGADYWLNQTAPWDNYTTNVGLGVGQLRRVTSAWQWFGYTTASQSALYSLYADGFTG